MNKGADSTISAKSTFQKNTAERFPICIAAEDCDIELMQLILEKGADINSNTPSVCLDC